MRASVPGEVRLGTRDPELIGEYRLLGRLAEGGQGVVYLAESPSGTRVALKLLRAAWLTEPHARERLAKEVAAARHVARFCTAQVIAADVDGEQPYIVSEYVEGPSLTQHVREHGPLTGAALDRLAIGTVTALVAIHQARIVHRDLKPSNVMLGPDGPRVIDFGIARDLVGDSTSTDRVMGTPTYMAPEQMQGGQVGPAADLWSWSATMVFAATGRPPFSAENVVALMYQVVHAEPRLDGVTGPLRAVVERCLVKDPAARPPAEDVLFGLLGQLRPARTGDDVTDLDAALVEASRRAAETTTDFPASPVPAPLGASTPPVPAPTISPTPPVPLIAQRRRRPVGPLVGLVVAAAVLVAGGGLAVHALFGWPPSPGAVAQPGVSSSVGSGASAVSASPVSSRAAVTPTSLPTVTERVYVTPTEAVPSLTTSRPAVPTRTAAATRPAATTPPAPSAPAATTAKPPAPQGLTVPAAFDGTWTGTAQQSGGVVDTFQVRITLRTNASLGGFELVDVGCVGTVTVVAPTPTSSTLYLHQRTTNDGIQCSQGGSVRLKALGGGQVDFSWVDDGSATNTAHGVLTRS